MNAHSKSQTSNHNQPTTHYQRFSTSTKLTGHDSSKLSTQRSHAVNCKRKILPYIKKIQEHL